MKYKNVKNEICELSKNLILNCLHILSILSDYNLL